MPTRPVFVFTLTSKKGAATATTVWTDSTANYNGDYWAVLESLERFIASAKAAAVNCGDYMGVDRS